jgi:LacI family transcriptional regulator
MGLSPLTTVRQPLADMGRVAAGMLGDLIEGVPLRSQRVELSTELIVRESTAEWRVSVCA